MDRRSNWFELFGLFRCPRCGHFQRHPKLLVTGSWTSYNWCGECASYFRLKYAPAYIILWSIVVAVIGVPVAVLLGRFIWDSTGFWAGVYFVEAFVGIGAWILVRRLFPYRFEYVGKDAP